MLKMFRYMKRYTVWILVILALLFLQAYCDLALPSYTSNIVNVGIQQSGIEDSVPEKISSASAQVLEKFMTPDQIQEFNQSYELKGETYELKDLTKKERNSLNESMNQAMIYFTMAASGGSMSGNGESEGSTQALDMEQVSAVGQQILSMSDEAIAQMKTQLDTAIKTLPDTMKSQLSIYFVRAEYQQLKIDLDSLQQKYILYAGLKMLGMALIIVLASIMVTFFSCRVGAGFSRDMREKVYGKVLSFSNNEFNHFSTASLITRSTNDIQQVQMVMTMMFRMVLYAPIIGIGGIFKALNTSVSMSWIIALAVIVILMLVGILMAVAMPKFKSLQVKIDRLNQVMREILTGLPVIRAFSTQQHEEDRFDGVNMDLMKTNLFVNRCMTFMMPAMMLIMNGVSLLIVYNGALGIDNGTMQVGDMMAFIQYTMQIIMAFLMITMMSVMLPRASVSGNRIAEILETKDTILDPKDPVKPDLNAPTMVEFRNVNFAYPGADENVLSNISFQAEHGKTTAFIGSTGSGKSTLVNLIPRFYDVSSGEVLINGVDIRKYTLHDLHGMLGYVPQKGVLFSGTIASNILYGCDEPASLSEEEKEQWDQKTAKEAAGVAQAWEFIDEKPEGYDSEISQGGTNVSGGQKQRLSIARAIAKDPSIFIFDDSFSALDYKTDVTLRKALQEKTKDAVTLIVAQRISTILHADQIVVLDEGKVAGIGTHKELLQSCEIYQQIAQSQLSKEELAHE